MFVPILIIFLFISFSAQASPLAPHLSDSNLNRVLEIRDRRSPPVERERDEKRYQRLVQKQTLSDLIEFYKPENQSKVETVYASFTPEGTIGGGDDLGYGLHIVKRFKRVLPDGTEKITDINELWPEDRVTNGLFLPDEIRIKTLAVSGERRKNGSYKLYLFDSIRVAWGPRTDEIQLGRRTRYHGGHPRQMRVPVSAPFSCMGCHDPDSGFGESFRQSGETLNPEAIVQDSQFITAPEKQPGYEQYMKYLKEKGKPQSFMDQVARSLKDVARATAVPGIRLALESTVSRNEHHWLSDDGSVISSYDLLLSLNRQGYYRNSDGKMFRDVIEDLIEGKYRWWEPSVVVPFSKE